MSIATVVTRGFGSFGGINYLPTIGYSFTVLIGPGICANGTAFVQGAFAGYAGVFGAFGGADVLQGVVDGSAFVQGSTVAANDPPLVGGDYT